MSSKAIKPRTLDLDPNESTAKKEWKHWRKTFENYIEVAEVADAHKLKYLVNSVTADVYEFFEECATYDAAVTLLENLYVKKPNEVTSRHLLSSTRQQPGQSLDEYLRTLNGLAKNCTFNAVTATVYRDEYVRDTFIAGICSNTIRERLLENDTLTLKAAVDQARVLEQSHINGTKFKYDAPGGSTPLASAITPDPVPMASFEDESPGNLAAAYQKQCGYCGKSPHPRSRCPARNSICGRQVWLAWTLERSLQECKS